MPWPATWSTATWSPCARCLEGSPRPAVEVAHVGSGQGPAPSSRGHGSLHAYVVVSLLTGARTEELRALTWDHVDLDGKPERTRQCRPRWRLALGPDGGDTKTPEVPPHCRPARPLRRRPAPAREHSGRGHLECHRVVFAPAAGSELDAANVRRAFRRVTPAAGLDPADWTPRELRHSFVSLLSDGGVPIEEIADLVGHSGTTVTEKVYRHQLRPVLLTGAVAMDQIFPGAPGAFVTQLVTQARRKAMSVDRLWPLCQINDLARNLV